MKSKQIEYLTAIAITGIFAFNFCGRKINCPCNDNNFRSDSLKHKYGLISCANPEITGTIEKTRAGILKCSANSQTHYADVAAQWGKNTWINDLYFGLHGGLFIADQKEQDVFKAELRKVAKYVLEEHDTLEIVPYSVSDDGASFQRNDVSGLDYDRAAEYILKIIRVYEFSGDKEFLEELYPVMVRVINWLGRQNRDGDILLEGRSLPPPITGVGSCVSVSYIGDAVKNDYKDFGASMFYFHALKKMATIEKILGRDVESAEHDRIAGEVQKAIDVLLWNEISGGYLAWIDENNVKMENWITGNNLHAVYCGLTSESQTSAIIKTLDDNRDTLINQVPCRVSLDIYPSGYSSNANYYYWNAGSWTLVSAPVMLGFRKANDVQSALHVMKVLSSPEVAKTQFGFFESYWSNSRKPNTCEGLLMNNGGVLWGFHEGVLGVSVNGDQLIFQKEIPCELLPVKAKFRYRGADLEICWYEDSQFGATIDGKKIQPTTNAYIFEIRPKNNDVKRINIAVKKVVN